MKLNIINYDSLCPFRCSEEADGGTASPSKLEDLRLRADDLGKIIIEFSGERAVQLGEIFDLKNENQKLRKELKSRNEELGQDSSVMDEFEEMSLRVDELWKKYIELSKERAVRNAEIFDLKNEN